MASLDVVAGAIKRISDSGDWPPNEYYRTVAKAAIEAMGLTEEKCTYEETETKSFSGGEGVMSYAGQSVHVLGWRTDKRLVSPWTRSE